MRKTKQDHHKAHTMDNQPPNPTPNPIDNQVQATTNLVDTPTPNQVNNQAPVASGWLARARSRYSAYSPAMKAYLVVLALVVVLGLVGLVTKNTVKTKHSAVSSSQVSIQASGFFPKTISIKAGSTVAWTNYDSNPHQVASDPYPKDNKLASLNSLAMQPKDSFSYTFNQKGTYTYHDNLNPYKLQGTVRVE